MRGKWRSWSVLDKLKRLCAIIDRKNVPPCNYRYLDISALQLPTLARHLPITSLNPS